MLAMNVEKSSEIIILHPQNILFMYRMLLVLSVYKYIVLRFLHPPNILVTFLSLMNIYQESRRLLHLRNIL